MPDLGIAFQLVAVGVSMDQRDYAKEINSVRKAISRDVEKTTLAARLDTIFQQMLMQYVFSQPDSLVAMNGWSITSEFAWWLFNELKIKKPDIRIVLELGSGVSTVVLAAALKGKPNSRLVSIEHDYEYYCNTRRLLEGESLLDYVNLIYAPLVEYELNGEIYKWYDIPFDMLEQVIGVGNLDLVLVDGPPAATNRHARYPAYPLLKRFLSDNAKVILDDAGREQEKEILQMWDELDSFESEVVYLKGFRHDPAVYSARANKTNEKIQGKDWFKNLENRLINDIEKVELQGPRNNIADVVREFISNFFDLREERLNENKRHIATLAQKIDLQDEEINRIKKDLVNKDAQIEFEKNRNRTSEEKIVACEAKITNLLDGRRELEKSIHNLKNNASQFEAELNEANLLISEMRAKLSSARLQRDMYEERLGVVSRQLISAEKQIKILDNSLAFQLGKSIINQSKSVKGYLKMPVAIWRVVRRAQLRARGNDVKAKRKEIKNYSKDLQLLMENAKASTVLWVASQVADQRGYDEAVTFAKKYLHLSQEPALNLLIANKYLSSEKKWLFYVNKYIEQYGLSSIVLAEQGTSRFSRLTSISEIKVLDGSKISVIMPAYNAESTLAHAAQSILNQTWKNIELIIVDDCSTDETWNVANSIALSDPRVILLRNVANVGPYVSKNLALRVATGKYITGQDADDWSHPQRLQRDMELLGNGSSIKAVLSSMLRMNASGEFCRFAKIGLSSLDGARRVSSISLLIEKNTLRQKLGGWDSVRFGADSELIIRAEKVLGDDFIRADHIGMFCLDLETSLTNDPIHGVSKVHGISPTRKEYRNSYAQWHKKIDINNAVLPFPHMDRYFSAPEPMLVAMEYIERNIRDHDQQMVRVL